MRTKAPALLPLFRSELQAKLLSRLLLTDDEIGVSALARVLGAPQPTVHRETARLVEAEILVDRWVGRIRLVSANRANPAYPPLRQLLTIVFGPSALLTSALADVEGIERALIYGSWAARSAGKTGPPPHDIDVLIVGDPDPETLHDALTGVEERLCREVNYVTVSPDTWAARDSDPFLSSIAAGPAVDLKESDEPIGY
ncbi:winged helix-turn-helix transcriptional regulator [Nakamurella sp. DB0629]|uniref:Winged helix-turn-helix transcriptional regulator n=1 Tax=Nakamurella aerolata TaxID=1656892 RepID=A0A849ABH1_9ACTN|nr:winged helix-turn-helix transcriptional regulator [Nakamurella aerolata]